MRCFVILALVLAGCASPAKTFKRPLDLYSPPAEYVYSYDALYAELFWRCTEHERGGVRVDGYAVTSLRNNMAIPNFWIRLFARDAKGNTLAQGFAFGDDQSPSNLDPVPFAVSVPAADGTVRYDLYYNFEIADGDGDGGGTSQVIPRVQKVRMVPAAGLIYFGTIEDVCGARWQRKLTPPGS